ncbi:hypothetical protein EVAR_96050_1 [Eumeta japonica]|uniref:Secreted protein n=1 Tax=Eumeta variegata TaxID=151549 RepID=A0A4C1WAC9_EUMVA|nr:hypothetical protein EVAR_96050_1 [Eumeta japonica]
MRNGCETIFIYLFMIFLGNHLAWSGAQGVTVTGLQRKQACKGVTVTGLQRKQACKGVTVTGLQRKHNRHSRAGTAPTAAAAHLSSSRLAPLTYDRVISLSNVEIERYFYNKKIVSFNGI